MAGNESVARQRAYNAWDTARNNGTDPKDVAKLRGAFDAAVAVENTATGKPGQNRG